MRGSPFATTSATGVQVHQYVAGAITAAIGDGRQVRLRVETAYPADGLVRLIVEETDDQPWELGLRVPASAAGASLTVAGEAVAAEVGLVIVDRTWAVGDVVELALDLTPRIVRADSRVDALRDQIAVERGPLIYCAESVDQPDVDLNSVRVDASAPITVGEPNDQLLGLLTVTISAMQMITGENGWPYLSSVTEREAGSVDLTLVPYFLWANRGLSTMRIWLPEGHTTGQG